MARWFRRTIAFALAAVFALATLSAAAQQPVKEPLLGVGDAVKITVYQNPDLNIDSRISETGQVNMPLIGAIAIGNMTASAAQAKIEKALKDGGFVNRPQVTVQTVAIRSSQISILGQVGKPGRYPIEIVGSKVSEMIAAAGGAVAGASDIVTFSGTRDGKPVKLEIDLPAILQAGRSDQDLVVENGDVLFIDRAPVYYINGEVQRPGQYRLERGMTLQQALAQAGGISQRGTDRGIRITRRETDGTLKTIEPKMLDRVQRDDVIFIRESIF